MIGAIGKFYQYWSLHSWKKKIEHTHRENTPSNEAEVLTKSMNMFIWAIDTLNQQFIKGLVWECCAFICSTLN